MSIYHRNVQKANYYDMNEYIMNITKALVNLKDDDGNLLGQQNGVNVFAKYFHFVYSKTNDFQPHFDKRSNVLLRNIEIDVRVDRHLQTLSNKYSSGPDNIPNILLKNLHSSLALPLSLIFQQSINTGCLPKLWKCANIVPIYKGYGSKYCVENYRPKDLHQLCVK